MLAHPTGLLQAARDPELSHVPFALNRPQTQAQLCMAAAHHTV